MTDRVQLRDTFRSWYGVKVGLLRTNQKGWHGSFSNLPRTHCTPPLPGVLSQAIRLGLGMAGAPLTDSAIVGASVSDPRQACSPD